MLVTFEYRNFSNGQLVDSVETEKSRIVLYELESDWWILAVSDSENIQSSEANRISTVNRPYSNFIPQYRQCVFRSLFISRVLFARNLSSSVPDPTTATSAFDIPVTPWRLTGHALPTSRTRIFLQTPQPLLEQICPSLARASQRQPGRGSVQWYQTSRGRRAWNWCRRRRMGQW